MKRTLSLLLVLSMFFALSACSGSNNGETAESSAPTSSSPEESDTPYTGSDSFDITKYDGVEFEIMWQESDTTQIDIVENYAQKAVQDQFGDYVDIKWIGNVDTNYTTLAQTGELADVWFGNTTLEMIESDIILDMTPYLTVDTYLQDNFSNPDFFYFRDSIWTLSTGVDNFYTGALYINQDIFDELGISSDFATYDELYADCQTLLDADYLPLSLNGTDNGGAFAWFMFQDLIISVDPQAYVDVLNGGDIGSDAVVRAMQLFTDMRDAGFLGTGVSVKNISDAVSEFVEGKAAMLYTASWNNDSINAADFNVTVAWWPTANDQHATTDYKANWGSPQSGWTINAATQYPELAVEIVKCVVKAEAERHLNAGLSTNYFQNGTPTPANRLEEQRAVIYGEVGTWYKGFFQNTMDSATQTEWTNLCSTLMSDDGYPVSEYIAALQTAWNTNTYFD